MEIECAFIILLEVNLIVSGVDLLDQKKGYGFPFDLFFSQHKIETLKGRTKWLYK